jgi:hypothetical protein
VVLITIERAIVFALLYLQTDMYLLNNCCAVLLNISPVVTEVSAATAEKLVTMCVRLCKRIVKGSAALETTGISSESFVNSHIDSYAHMSKFTNMDSFGEAVGVLFRVFGTLLRAPARVSNIQLLYALIHDMENVNKYMFHVDIVRILQACEPTASMSTSGFNLITVATKRGKSPSMSFPLANTTLRASDAVTVSENLQETVNFTSTWMDFEMQVHLQSPATICLHPASIRSMCTVYLELLEKQSEGGFISASKVC